MLSLDLLLIYVENLRLVWKFLRLKNQLSSREQLAMIKKYFERFHIITCMKTNEALLEAAPQLILQVYIMAKGRNKSK